MLLQMRTGPQVWSPPARVPEVTWLESAEIVHVPQATSHRLRADDEVHQASVSLCNAMQNTQATSASRSAWRHRGSCCGLTPALTRDDGGRQAAGSRRVERLVRRH